MSFATWRWAITDIDADLNAPIESASFSAHSYQWRLSLSKRPSSSSSSSSSSSKTTTRHLLSATLTLIEQHAGQLAPNLSLCCEARLSFIDQRNRSNSITDALKWAASTNCYSTTWANLIDIEELTNSRHGFCVDGVVIVEVEILPISTMKWDVEEWSLPRERVVSPPMKFSGGLVWRLGLYMQGYQDAAGTHVSVYLGNHDIRNWDKSLQYRVTCTITAVHPEDNAQATTLSTVDRYFSVKCVCWGMSKFLCTDECRKLLVNDMMTFLTTVTGNVVRWTASRVVPLNVAKARISSKRFFIHGEWWQLALFPRGFMAVEHEATNDVDALDCSGRTTHSAPTSCAEGEDFVIAVKCPTVCNSRGRISLHPSVTLSVSFADRNGLDVHLRKEPQWWYHSISSSDHTTKQHVSPASSSTQCSSHGEDDDASASSTLDTYLCAHMGSRLHMRGRKSHLNIEMQFHHTQCATWTIDNFARVLFMEGNKITSPALTIGNYTVRMLICPRGTADGLHTHASAFVNITHHVNPRNDTTLQQTTSSTTDGPATPASLSPISALTSPAHDQHAITAGASQTRLAPFTDLRITARIGEHTVHEVIHGVTLHDDRYFGVSTLIPIPDLLLLLTLDKTLALTVNWSPTTEEPTRDEIHTYPTRSSDQPVNELFSPLFHPRHPHQLLWKQISCVFFLEFMEEMSHMVHLVYARREEGHPDNPFREFDMFRKAMEGTRSPLGNTCVNFTRTIAAIEPAEQKLHELNAAQRCLRDMIDSASKKALTDRDTSHVDNDSMMGLNVDSVAELRDTLRKDFCSLVDVVLKQVLDDGVMRTSSRGAETQTMSMICDTPSTVAGTTSNHSTASVTPPGGEEDFDMRVKVGHNNHNNNHLYPERGDLIKLVMETAGKEEDSGDSEYMTHALRELDAWQIEMNKEWQAVLVLMDKKLCTMNAAFALPCFHVPAADARVSTATITAAMNDTNTVVGIRRGSTRTAKFTGDNVVNELTGLLKLLEAEHDVVNRICGEKPVEGIRQLQHIAERSRFNNHKRTRRVHQRMQHLIVTRDNLRPWCRGKPDVVRLNALEAQMYDCETDLLELTLRKRRLARPGSGSGRNDSAAKRQRLDELQSEIASLTIELQRTDLARMELIAEHCALKLDHFPELGAHNDEYAEFQAIAPLFSSRRTIEIYFFTDGHLLHDGNHRVYKGTFGGEECALKEFYSKEELIREAKLLYRLRHPSIVPIRAVFYHGGRGFIHMPLLPSNLAALANQKADAARVLHIADRILVSVRHIHEFQIVHGDLTPQNYLMNEDGMPMLCDFGQSLNIGEGVQTNEVATRSDKLTGIRGFVAPEITDGSRPSKASDMYSVGCIFRFLISCASDPSQLTSFRALADQLSAENCALRPSVWVSLQMLATCAVNNAELGVLAIQSDGSESVTLPPYWRNKEGTFARLIPSKYVENMASRLLRTTAPSHHSDHPCAAKQLPKMEVTKVERNENPVLFKCYAQRREEIREHHYGAKSRPTPILPLPDAMIPVSSLPFPVRDTDGNFLAPLSLTNHDNSGAQGDDSPRVIDACINECYLMMYVPPDELPQILEHGVEHNETGACVLHSQSCAALQECRINTDIKEYGSREYCLLICRTTLGDGDVHVLDAGESASAREHRPHCDSTVFLHKTHDNHTHTHWNVHIPDNLQVYPEYVVYFRLAEARDDDEK
eukprot:GEMP01000340.1.p1 GENE.GEMP01000340.1~~GEMP01000340.1.p1  ORF type:complete len:1705 (+),score=383.54 GEMP01000340.1:33-5117(+)